MILMKNGKNYFLGFNNLFKYYLTGDRNEYYS